MLSVYQWILSIWNLAPLFLSAARLGFIFGRSSFSLGNKTMGALPLLLKKVESVFFTANENIWLKIEIFQTQLFQIPCQQCYTKTENTLTTSHAFAFVIQRICYSFAFVIQRIGFSRIQSHARDAFQYSMGTMNLWNFAIVTEKLQLCENHTLHYRLGRPIGFWKVQKVVQIRHLGEA